MSKNDYELKASEIGLITNAPSPAVPVGHMIQEAEDTYVWCQPDKELLVRAGLDWKYVEDLPIRAGALRYIQSIWQQQNKTSEEGPRQWKKKSDEAYALRDQLVHDFLHAFRKLPDLHARTQEIAEGNTHADMIQDLSDLAILGKANTEVLAGIGMDLSLLDKAEAQPGEIAALLAQSNGERMSDNSDRVIRDKAYAYLKEALDEIRQHGQYVFWRNNDRLKGYVSKYHKQRNRKNKSKGDQEE